MQRYTEHKPVSDKYFTWLHGTGFVEIIGKPVKLTLFGVELDAVLHNAAKDETDFVKWNIIEQQTGMKLNGDSTQKAALAAAEKALRQAEINFNISGQTEVDCYDEYFAGKPLSPRYQKKTDYV